LRMSKARAARCQSCMSWCSMLEMCCRGCECRASPTSISSTCHDSLARPLKLAAAGVVAACTSGLANVHKVHVRGCRPVRVFAAVLYGRQPLSSHHQQQQHQYAHPACLHTVDTCAGT
jgi:hypothetical protein